MIAAMINTVVSVATVKVWGLIGVAIGTLAAMAYQTVWMAIYNSRYLIKWPIKNFLKQIGVDALTAAAGFFATKFIAMHGISSLAWIMLAVKETAVWCVITVIINMIFYPSKMLGMVQRVKKAS